MTQNKTVKTDASVDEFIASIAHPTRRQDAAVLVDLFSKVTGYAPKMWGDSIVGFGKYHYRYATGREGDFLERLARKESQYRARAVRLPKRLYQKRP